MSSALLQDDRASKSTTMIGIRPRSASSKQLPFLLQSGVYDVSRVICDATSEQHEALGRVSKAEALIMSEVADYLESSHCDDFWRPRHQPLHKAFPTATQLLAQLRDLEERPDSASSGVDTFNLLLHAIALQLLASCHSILPASGATQLPLFPQRTKAKPITALRVHSQHRFEPAAGHHARVSSEAPAWSDLYAGPTVEESLAEAVSSRRRSRNDRKHVPGFSGSGWTDGSSSPAQPLVRAPTSAPSESSIPPQQGLLAKLMCQISSPGSAKRKHKGMLPKRLSWKKKKQSATHNPKDEQLAAHSPSPSSTTSRSSQRSPSPFRLRRTQSAPRVAVDLTPPNPDTSLRRRHSSNTSTCSPLHFPYNIPEIRRISATTFGAASQTKRSMGSTPDRKGSVISDWDPYEDTRASRVRQSVSASGRERSVAEEHMDEERISHTDHDPYSQAPHDPDALKLPSPAPDVVAPRAILPSPQKARNAAVHAATRVHDSEEAGPGIGESETLQHIFAMIDDSSGEYSSDSDMERNRKRESSSIVAGSLESYQLARRYTGSSEGSSRLRGVEEGT